MSEIDRRRKFEGPDRFAGSGMVEIAGYQEMVYKLGRGEGDLNRFAEETATRVLAQSAGRWEKKAILPSATGRFGQHKDGRAAWYDPRIPHGAPVKSDASGIRAGAIRIHVARWFCGYGGHWTTAKNRLAHGCACEMKMHARLKRNGKTGDCTCSKCSLARREARRGAVPQLYGRTGKQRIVLKSVDPHHPIVCDSTRQARAEIERHGLEAIAGVGTRD